MKNKVRLFHIFICMLLVVLFCTACHTKTEVQEPVSTVPVQQDTLEREPDFSYVVTPQQPHILIDKNGYHSEDKKVAFFYGNDLKETFEIRQEQSEETVYSGVLHQVKEIDGKVLYTGIFTDFSLEGNYFVHHEQVGDSYVFYIDNAVYNEKFQNLEAMLFHDTYTDVSSLAYLLANYMFIEEMFADSKVDASYIKEGIQTLLYARDEKTGAFYKEMLSETTGTVSLSATAQMAGVLAQYVYLFRETEDPVFINQCLLAAQNAYTYVETYRDNTDTDAWYFAAVQLYRTTKQYKYRNAIAQYDTFPVESRSSTRQGYTILADFTYLSTPYGTDYARCSALLDSYLDKAQSISANSSRENFYVLENMDTMTEKEILEDMVILGLVNHVLSGQEYVGIQKNYIHYLSGANMERKDYLNENILIKDGLNRINTDNAVKMLVVYGNLYSTPDTEMANVKS